LPTAFAPSDFPQVKITRTDKRSRNIWLPGAGGLAFHKRRVPNGWLTIARKRSRLYHTAVFPRLDTALNQTSSTSIVTPAVSSVMGGTIFLKPPAARRARSITSRCSCMRNICKKKRPAGITHCARFLWKKGLLNNYRRKLNRSSRRVSSLSGRKPAKV